MCDWGGGPNEIQNYVDPTPPSRDTEIERIDRCPDHVWEIEGDISLDQFEQIRDLLPKAAAKGEEIVVVAGVTLRRKDVRSQPASEPSLDVERLRLALDAHMQDFIEQPESFDESGLVADNIARHYQRLSQLADNDGAGTDQE